MTIFHPCHDPLSWSEVKQRYSNALINPFLLPLCFVSHRFQFTLETFVNCLCVSLVRRGLSQRLFRVGDCLSP